MSLPQRTEIRPRAETETGETMLGWFQALMPRDNRFFDLFESHAETLVAGALALQEMLQGGDRTPDACRRILEHEEAADRITREVLLAVRRTFITPFDRSDIKDLISSLDDAIDQMQKTAKVITLFEVRQFEPAMQAMGVIIVEAAQVTREAVGLISKMRQNASRLNALTEKIIKIEDQSDLIYDEGRKALYQAHRQADPMAFIIGVEIYSHLEKVVDRFEDVANRISGVVIEQL
jgi:predicted phosphate transport protein (TIGR00153 family)